MGFCPFKHPRQKQVPAALLGQGCGLLLGSKVVSYFLDSRVRARLCDCSRPAESAVPQRRHGASLHLLHCPPGRGRQHGAYDIYSAHAHPRCASALEPRPGVPRVAVGLRARVHVYMASCARVRACVSSEKGDKGKSKGRKDALMSERAEAKGHAHSVAAGRHFGAQDWRCCDF
jgi:hypothetical protein